MTFFDKIFSALRNNLFHFRNKTHSKEKRINYKLLYINMLIRCETIYKTI